MSEIHLSNGVFPPFTTRITWNMGEEFHRELARQEDAIDKLEDRIDKLKEKALEATKQENMESARLLALEVAVLSKRLDLMTFVKMRDFPVPSVKMPKYLVRNQIHSI